MSARDRLGFYAEAKVFDNAKIKRFVPEYQCRKSFRQGIREALLTGRGSVRMRAITEIEEGGRKVGAVPDLQGKRPVHPRSP